MFYKTVLVIGYQAVPMNFLNIKKINRKKNVIKNIDNVVAGSCEFRLMRKILL